MRNCKEKRKKLGPSLTEANLFNESIVVRVCVKLIYFFLYKKINGGKYELAAHWNADNQILTLKSSNYYFRTNCATFIERKDSLTRLEERLVTP